MIDVGALYEVAARAGLLALARVDGRAVPVDFRAPDVVLLDGLVLSHQYTMTYPAAWLPELGAGSGVDIGGQSYRVREITAVGDGSEQRATLTRV
ncbi:MAG: hypothetical protein IPH41_11220 [Sulfuritalea sp.]|nr:hypothetical protein [Sulfuritalea sp.]